MIGTDERKEDKSKIEMPLVHLLLLHPRWGDRKKGSHFLEGLKENKDIKASTYSKTELFLINVVSLNIFKSREIC